MRRLASRLKSSLKKLDVLEVFYWAMIAYVLALFGGIYIYTLVQLP